MDIKLRVRYLDETKPLGINQTSSLDDLKTLLGSLLRLDSNSVDISLNRQDSLTLQHSGSVSIADLGIVNGDTIFVTVGLFSSPSNESDILNTAAEPRANVINAGAAVSEVDSAMTDVEGSNVLKENDYAPSTSSQPPPEPMPSTSQHSNPVVVPDWLNPSVISLEAFLQPEVIRTASNSAELMILMLHALLRWKRYLLPGQSPTNHQMPAGWAASSAAGFYRLHYSHPATDVSLEMTYSVTGHGTQLLCNGSGKVGDTFVSQQCTLTLLDHVRQDLAYPVDSLKTSFLNAEDTVKCLLERFLDELSLAIVGQDTELARLPEPLKFRILKLLSVKALLSLSLTCKMFNKFGQHSKLWRHYLIRDFGASTLAEAEAAFESDYLKCYKAKHEDNYQQRRRQRQVQPNEEDDPLGRMMPRPPFYNPAGGIRDPRHPPNNPYFPGMIGGPDDLMPLAGHVAFPNIYPNMQQDPDNRRPGQNPLIPGRGGRIPGPRFDPMLPDDPDAGLHPFPGGGSRRNPRGGGFPSNPFGRGFPDFL